MKSFFAGRETDLQQLMTFAADAFAGKASVAFVTGEAGIGKTALAEELIRRLQSKNPDMVVASGKCTVNEASYLPFRMILENLVNSEKRFIQLLPYTGTALTYALLENKQQCKQYLKEALPFLEIETRPELKLLGLQAISEIYRLLSKFENAKTMCQQIISWLLKNAEEPEELFYLAEARLVMGKILVDMGNYQESTLIPHQKK